MANNPPAKPLKSPLRYPGGKGTFGPYFVKIMKQNGLYGGKYLEPFAGGAGVALVLLSSGAASEIILNDADYHIYCFWVSILDENERFCDKIRNVDISIREWQNQKKIYMKPNQHNTFDVGFSTFFLNRCNRSGIIAGAGPIGGYKQEGKWRLDVRFNKDDLITRIEQIGRLKNQIIIENLDAIVFLRNYLINPHDRDKVLVYIDPPYVSAGNRLYLNFYSNKDHIELAHHLLRQEELSWVVTYDDDIFIRELYDSCQKWLFNLGYSLQSKQKGKELLIAPEWLKLPKKNLTSSRWNLLKKIEKQGGVKNGTLR